MTLAASDSSSTTLDRDALSLAEPLFRPVMGLALRDASSPYIPEPEASEDGELRLSVKLDKTIGEPFRRLCRENQWAAADVLEGLINDFLERFGPEE